MKFSGLILSLLSAFAPVVAMAEYWVSIASFKNRDSAESALVNAQKQIEESLKVLGAPTDKGYFFRVVAGPYETQNQAKGAQSLLGMAGLNQGWIWQAQGARETARAAQGVNDIPEFESLEFDADWGTDLNYQQDLDFGPEDSQLPEAVEPAQKSLPEIPDTAPKGYQLNKLQREARAPPLEPINFVFSLSQTRPSIPPSSATLSTDTTPNDTIQTGSNSLNVVSFSRDAPVTLTRRDQALDDIEIDGRLDEGIWHELAGANRFLVSDPETLAKPAYETMVKAFYTDRGLYVAVDMEQPPATLVRRLSGRDGRRVNRDAVGVTVDTSGEGRYGYWMNVALGGSQSDGTVLPERQFSSDWDGAWYSGTAITDKGWSAEIFLPWSQVAMPQSGRQRTINVAFSRTVASLDESWGLPALPRSQPLYMSVMQPWQLEGVSPQQQWSFFPYVASVMDLLESNTKQNVGADVFWRPSTNFQATAAIKPDFGAVESDDVVVNLGAFETFFPEKRLFFQEGIEVFTATPRAEGGDPTTLLNTRRIGGIGRAPDLPDDVELSDLERQKPAELIGALKTVGSIGGFRYGLLGASEDETVYEAEGARYAQSGTDYGVARVLYESKSETGNYQALGFLSALTSHAEQNTQAHGVDYHYLTAQGEWKIDGQFLFSSADEQDDGFGGFADIRRNFGQGRRLHLGYSHYDEHLDINDLGFLKRNDLRGANGRYEVTRSDASRYRKSYISYWFRWERNDAGAYVRKGLGLDAEVDLLNRQQIRIGAAFFPGRDEDLDSRDNGTYRFGDRNRFEVRYRTDRAKAFSYEVKLRHETEKLGGANLSPTLGMTWRPRDSLSFAATLKYVHRNGWLLWRDNIDFATFDAEEWRPEVRMEYFASAKHQFKLLAQWVGIRASRQRNYQLQVDGAELTPVEDSVARSDDFAISNVSLQARYRWEIAPLSDLFVVYTRNGNREVPREAFDDLLSSTFDHPFAEQFAVKLRYRFGS